MFMEVSHPTVYMIKFETHILVASFPGPSQILSCSCGENRLRLQDKFREGPGNESNFFIFGQIPMSICYVSYIIMAYAYMCML